MKRASRKRQYTVRSVPASLDRALRERARQKRMSLNETILSTLEQALGSGSPAPAHDDLDFCIGTWTEDAAFDEAIAAQDQVDPTLWR